MKRPHAFWKFLHLSIFISLMAWLAACGTLEVGIEPPPARSSTPVAAPTFTPTVSLTPSSLPIPFLTETPSTGTPTPTVPLPISRERLKFASGSAIYNLAANLTEGVPQGYFLLIRADQHLFITTNDNVNIYVLNPNDQVLDPVLASPGRWDGIIPQTGDYTIVLLGKGSVNVTINIPPPG